MRIRKIEHVEIKENAGPAETARYLKYIEYWTRRLLSNFKHADDAQAKQGAEIENNGGKDKDNNLLRFADLEIRTGLNDLEYNFYHNQENQCRSSLDELKEKIKAIGSQENSCRELADNLVTAIDKVKKCSLKAGGPEKTEKAYADIRKFDSILESAFFDADRNDLENYDNHVKNTLSTDQNKTYELISRAENIPEVLVCLKNLKTAKCPADFSEICSAAAKFYKDYKEQNFKSSMEFCERLDELIGKTDDFHIKRIGLYNRLNMNEEFLRFDAVDSLMARLKVLRKELTDAGLGLDQKFSENGLISISDLFKVDGHAVSSEKIGEAFAVYDEMGDPSVVTGYLDRLADAKKAGEPGIDSLPAMLKLLESVESPKHNSSAYKDLVSSVRNLQNDYADFADKAKGVSDIKEDVRKIVKKIREYREHVSSTNGVNDVYRVNKEKAVNMLDEMISTELDFFLHTKLDEAYGTCMQNLKGSFETEGHAISPETIKSAMRSYEQMEDPQPVITVFLDRLADIDGKGKSGIDSVPAAVTLLESVKSPRYNSSDYNDLVFSVNVLHKDYTAGKDLSVIRKDVAKIVERINKYKEHVNATKGTNDTYRVNKMKAVNLLDQMIRTDFGIVMDVMDTIVEESVNPAARVADHNAPHAEAGAHADRAKNQEKANQKPDEKKQNAPDQPKLNLS